MFSGIFIENGGGEFTPFLFLNAKNSETDQMLTTLVESLKEEKKVCKTVHNISDPQFYTTNGAHGLARLSIRSNQKWQPWVLSPTEPEPLELFSELALIVQESFQIKTEFISI